MMTTTVAETLGKGKDSDAEAEIAEQAKKELKGSD